MASKLAARAAFMPPKNTISNNKKIFFIWLPCRKNSLSDHRQWRKYSAG
jgi:hypothetical protein